MDIKMFIDQCDGMGLAGAADCIESMAAEVDRLRRQIATYQRVAQENGGSAVDAMVAQDQIAEMRVEIERLKREAAAIQAREVQLRDSIIRFRNEKALKRAGSVRATEGYEECSEAIRALPGVKLEDLK